MTVVRRLCGEALGTAFLLAAIVGSGIMGERLANGNNAIALLANTLATGAALVALILTFGPISGAHFNPAVSLCDAMLGGISWKLFTGYITAQIIGAFVGVACPHAMFGFPLFSASQHLRSGPPQVFSEIVATFGLLAVIWGVVRSRPMVVPFCGRRLHNRCLLVYRVDIICESGCNYRACRDEHLRRHPARRRTGVRVGAGVRSRSVNHALSLADPENAPVRHGSRGTAYGRVRAQGFWSLSPEFLSNSAPSGRGKRAQVHRGVTSWRACEHRCDHSCSRV